MNLKKIIPLFFIAVFLVSFISPDMHYFILDESDYEFMREDNKSPALSIPDKNFKSYNKWQCFDVDDIQFLLAEIDYNGWHKIPSIKIGSMNFDLDPDINWDIEKVSNYWSDLVDGSRSICIFGAYLQIDDNKNSLWYIQKIKTSNGYWDRDRYDQFLKDE
jgi:hypothetical protein